MKEPCDSCGQLRHNCLEAFVLDDIRDHPAPGPLEFGNVMRVLCPRCQSDHPRIYGIRVRYDRPWTPREIAQRQAQEDADYREWYLETYGIRGTP